MPDSFDLVRGLGELPDRAAAWRFIRDFAVHWSTPVLDTDGVGEAELDAAEARLGVRLPAAVREAYRLFGRRADLTSENGLLYAPDELEYDAADQILVFRAAHQGVAFTGVSLADPTEPDPPTRTYTPMLDPEHEGWTPFLDRFSLTCVELVLWESVEGGGAMSDGRDQEAGEPAALVAGLTRLPFPRYPDEHGPSRWYANSEILLHDDGAWVGIRARTREALDEFRRAHPGHWVDDPAGGPVTVGPDAAS
ncbi:hypothetical protein [Plantactinospora sp. CA-290183]|uniref:hypothetical protein n=1 Tax=Plantactinospora sp. CA-290183 TaxID=3240006 RepID=UPI003D9048C0